jgi:uncharacterized protein
MTTMPIPRGAILIPVPDTRQQTGYTCGAAALRAVCEYFGVGPRTEGEFAEDMKMTSAGADPEHLIRALDKYGLRHKAFHRMSMRGLKGSVDRGRPVIMMLQAWGGTKKNPWPNYRNDWSDGHWVVAIGYNDDGVFFEDPSLRRVRGFMGFDELKVRWHDVGPHLGHMYYYGLAVWRSPRESGNRPGRSEHVERAEHID